MYIRITIYLVTVLIAAFVGTVRYKKLSTPFRLLTLLLLCTFVGEVLARITAIIFRNSTPVYYIMNLTEYVFFSAIYYNLLDGKLIKKAIISLAVITIIFWCVNAIILQPIAKAFPSNVLVTSEIIYALFSLILFRQMLLHPTQLSLFYQSIFWFNTAILFFSTTMFLYLGALNYVIIHKVNDDILNYFSAVVNWIFYVLLGLAIFLNAKETSYTNGR